MSGTQETFEALSHFLYIRSANERIYIYNEELINYLSSKELLFLIKKRCSREN